jgi:uncharacterized protein (DUF488 family)
VYGRTAEAFFETLSSAEISTLSDIRARPQMRGRTYMYANKRRLSERLADLGIEYRHDPVLAPTPELRAAQREADARGAVTKSAREALSPDFVLGFKHDILNSPANIGTLNELASIDGLCLLCVEAAPAACHRSLVANWIQREAGVNVTHL